MTQDPKNLRYLLGAENLGSLRLWRYRAVGSSGVKGRNPPLSAVQTRPQ
jgi:hypothetical protein